MTVQDSLNVVSTIYNGVWSMLTQIQVPGLGISFAAWTIAGLIITFSIALTAYTLGIGGNGSSQRSGQSRTKHISKERKNDEK